MVTVEKIHDSMFDEIFEEFLVDDDPELTRDDWRRLFTCRTETGQDYCGYALVDDEKIGGILGMIFSTRHINGEERKFCNLHTWMVKPAYRGNSLLLMRPALRLTDHTITDFTPTEPVRKIARKLGFHDLDASLRVLLPIRPRSHNSANNTVAIESDKETILDRLSGLNARFCRDHSGPACGHILLSQGNRDCYVVYSRVTRWALTYCHVHYISDPDLFSRFSREIRSRINRDGNAKLVVLNERQASGMKLPFSFRFPFTNGQLFRSNGVNPRQIDSLYSDVSLLSLATVTDLSHAVTKYLRFAAIKRWSMKSFQRTTILRAS